MNKIRGAVTLVAGLAIGIINALFGAGGGMVAVPFLKSRGKSQKEAQASAVAIILPLCIISATVYFLKGYYNLYEALKYVPFSLAGGIVGTVIFKKIPDRILRKIFSFLMLYLGIRMLF